MVNGVIYRVTFPPSIRRHRLTAIFLLGVLLAAFFPAHAAITPYTADVATLHLWHLDEAAAPCVDSVAGGTNLAYLLGAPVLGGAGASGNFSNAISFGTLATPAAIALLSGSGNVGTVSPFTFAGADGAFTFEALLQIGFNCTNFVRAQPCQILNCDANGTGTRVFQFRLLPVGFVGGGGDTNVVRLEFINGTATAAVVPIPTNGGKARSMRWG
ncbi:MAG: hypothetical protein RL616_629 [Verrucomicrobiota bacterium]